MSTTSAEQFRGEPRRRTGRVLAVAIGLLAVIVTVAFWNAWRQPSYLPPPGDQIDILLELAGVFPDNYKVMWREHAVLRASDPEARAEPALLGDALFMHRLTTGGEDDISIEAEYRFYELDRRAAAEPRFTCRCDPFDGDRTSCQGQLVFGNYEFTLSARYNREQCTNPIEGKRREEFARAMQTAERLIGLYLKPLRRKSSWL